MTGRLKHLARAHGMEVVAVACIVALVISVNPAKLAGVYAHANVRLVLLMIPVAIGTYLARSLGWWVACAAPASTSTSATPSPSSSPVRR